MLKFRNKIFFLLGMLQLSCFKVLAQFEKGEAAEEIVDSASEWVPVMKIIVVLGAFGVLVGGLIKIRDENADRLKILGGIASALAICGLAYWILSFVE